MDSHILLGLFIIVVGLGITHMIVNYALYYSDNSKEKDPFLDSEGNHIYYERSIIEKNKFHKQNPNIKREELRTFSYLIRTFIDPKTP